MSFKEHVKDFVDALMDEANRLAGHPSTYEAANQVRAAIVPRTAEKKGQGVFMLIAPTNDGATLIQPHLAAEDDCKSVRLGTSNLPEAIEALRRWYKYAEKNPTAPEDE